MVLLELLLYYVGIYPLLTVWAPSAAAEVLAQLAGRSGLADELMRCDIWAGSDWDVYAFLRDHILDWADQSNVRSQRWNRCSPDF